MGVSSDGKLCYGFSLGDEEGVVPDFLLDGEEEVGFDDFLAKLYKIPYPEGEYSREDKEIRERFEAYWDEKRKLEDLVGIVIVRHCSSEYNMYILAVAESVQVAGRGDLVELGQSITTKADWRYKLRAFCDKAGIDFQEPQFILCSYAE